MNKNRRINLDLYEPAEWAIRNAILEVESMGADIRLTNAVMLLEKARNLVSDVVDERLSASILTLGTNR